MLCTQQRWAWSSRLVDCTVADLSDKVVHGKALSLTSCTWPITDTHVSACTSTLTTHNEQSSIVIQTWDTASQ